MKKIILLLLIAIAAINTGAYAQPVQIRSQVMLVRNAAGTIKAADTLTNTDTNTIGYRVGYPYDISIQATYTKLTGYGRGTSKLQGTMDSVNGPWYTVRGDQTRCPACIDSMYTWGNASSTARWEIPKCRFNYLRLYNRTDTTETFKNTASMFYGY